MSRQELLEENRFLAARDGADARLIDARAERRVPVRQQVRELLDACGPHAAALGCEAELAGIEGLAERGGAERQVARARADDRLPGLVETLADEFCDQPAEPASVARAAARSDAAVRRAVARGPSATARPSATRARPA